MTNINTKIVKASEKRVLESKNKDTKIKNRKIISDACRKALPIMAYIIVFIIYSFGYDNVSFSNVLLLFTSAYSFVMEIDAWVEFKNKNIFLNKVRKTFGPLITSVYAFIPLAFIFIKSDFINYIPTNTVTLIVMGICVISYSIRSVEIIKSNTI